MKITRTSNKVIFGDKVFSQECNIFPHPRSTRAILISEIGTNQNENDSFIVDYNSLQDYKGDAFAVANRTEMIHLLAFKYFNRDYKIDASRFLKDANGNTGFNQNYSTVATKAVIKTNGSAMHIARLLIFIADSGSVDAGKYGNNITLTNGIVIKHEKEDGTLINDITDGQPIKTNADYAKFGFQVSDVSFGSGLNYVHAVLTFEKNGTAIRLRHGEQLAIYLNDNFTALTEHTFRVGAYYME